MWKFNPTSYNQLINVHTQQIKRIKSTESDILTILKQHEGNYVSKENLLSQVWGERVVSEANLTQSISQLRLVLGDSGKEQKIIKTKPKEGYMLLPGHIAFQDDLKRKAQTTQVKPSQEDEPAKLNKKQKISAGLSSSTKLKDWIYGTVFIIATLNIFYTFDIIYNVNNPPEYKQVKINNNNITFILDHTEASNDLYQYLNNKLPKNIHNLFISKNPDSFYVSCIFTTSQLNEKDITNLSFTSEYQFDYILERIVEKCS
ncbi:transcriptional regulator, CadC [Photobacterium marinum]|uniref:Transcriptional regulator, CadC n=1 Tax=Photobacterium marinum TaxID=1056511 RepID=L8JEI3_9GAMM|nr:winged helix-turn-helix domain-containing protein [Photobacterium marinum]ELR67246.1 transcriptional regulator, CadC [Photobacterium marinum]